MPDEFQDGGFIVRHAQRVVPRHSRLPVDLDRVGFFKRRQMVCQYAVDKTGHPQELPIADARVLFNVP